MFVFTSQVSSFIKSVNKLYANVLFLSRRPPPPFCSLPNSFTTITCCSTPPVSWGRSFSLHMNTHHSLLELLLQNFLPHIPASSSSFSYSSFFFFFFLVFFFSFFFLLCSSSSSSSASNLFIPIFLLSLPHNLGPSSSSQPFLFFFVFLFFPSTILP